ncbi:MAG: SprT family zinc-dependent metalloprotease [bacterium]
MIEYTLRESNQARAVRITVRADGSVSVTKPVRVSLRLAEKFVEEKQEWIEKTRERFAKRRANGKDRVVLPKLRRGTSTRREAVRTIRTLIGERLAHFNREYGYKVGTISIRDQKTRWGSCSLKGNLSFNYRLLYLPPTHRDYVIVHELCHIKEHNHSKAFWLLVGRTIPDARAIRRELRSGYSL